MRFHLDHLPLQRFDFDFEQSANPHFGHVNLRGVHPERFFYLAHSPALRMWLDDWSLKAEMSKIIPRRR